MASATVHATRCHPIRPIEAHRTARIHTAYPERIEYSDDMRPILVIGEVIAGSDGPTGAGAEVALRLAGDSMPVVLVSRIGHGEIGDRLIRNLRDAGVDCDSMQYDYDLPTLRSQAIVHDYERTTAFDQLQWDSDLETLARRAAILVVTSGIRRKGQARSTCDRAMLAAEGSPRIFLAQQDTAAIGPVTRTLFGRALELSEVLVAAPEALEPLRIRTPSDATELLQRSALLAVLLTKGNALDVASGDTIRAIDCPEGDTSLVDSMLKSLAKGLPLNQSLDQLGSQ